MFLTDKHHSSLLTFHHGGGAAAAADSRSKRHRGKAPVGAGPALFGATLAARLRGLTPLLPASSPLAALARLADLLALTLADAVRALAGEGDAAAVAAHLDAGVALLDACNAITARIDRLRRRRLLSRFAVHLLSSSSSSPSSIRRARDALADREDRSPPASPLPPLPSLPFDQTRGDRLSAAASVLLAVDAISALAAAAAAAVLGGTALQVVFPQVSGEFPWAESFNAVSSQLSGLATKPGEVDAVDEAVRKLTSILDSEGHIDEAALQAATQEVEKRTEELTARLDRLSDAVNGVFRAALCLRNAEIGSFIVGPAEKTTCK